MNFTPPTREINRRLLLTLHQDGLLDVLAGLIVVNFGFVPILDQAGLNPGVRQVLILAFYGASILGVIWLKRRITLPRSGYVKLARRFTSRIFTVILVANVFIFLLFAGAYLFNLRLWAFFGAYQLSVPLGLVFLVMLTVSGGMLKAPRFFLYGMMVLGVFVFFEHLFLLGMVAHHGIPVAAFISGGVMIAAGVVLLVRFLNKYTIDR